MRTREELIAGLSCAIFNQHDNIDECLALARKYILEAERRTEQRVRAEIGRALESALYTATRNTFARSIGPRTLEIFDQEYKSAIDAAREMG